MIRAVEQCDERKRSVKFMNREKELNLYHDADFSDKKVADSIKYLRRRTSLIVSMLDAKLSAVDIYKMLDTGLKIARFRMASWTVADRLKLLGKLETACKLACEKYAVHVWPLALDIELKTCGVKSGVLEKNKRYFLIKPNVTVTLTNDPAYKLDSNDKIIYVGNDYLTQECKVGAEISIINARDIILECVGIIDKHSVKCKVLSGGYLTNTCYVCIRDIDILRPLFTEQDQEYMEFAAKYKIDIVTINYTRRVESIREVRKYFKQRNYPVPVIFASICTEECLRNIDDIIKESDAILIAREFLSYELSRPKNIRLPKIQKWIIAKCVQVGKPVYLSGGLFQEGLRRGDFNYSEVADVANAVLDGVSGFQLKGFDSVELTVLSMQIMDDICRTVEPFKPNHANFWRMVQEIRMPINAAQAAAMACVAAARQTQAAAIIMPTISGKSVATLLYFQPPSLIIICCRNDHVCKKLRIYHNTVPIVCPPQLIKHKKYSEIMEIMTMMTIEYAVARSFLVYGDYYVTFQRGHETSSYHDTVTIWKTVLQRKNAIECPDTSEVPAYSQPTTAAEPVSK